MEKFKELKDTPLIIGGKKIESRIHLAPMAGLGHIAYREILSHFGGYGLMFTEMCSAKALPSENPRLSKMFRWREEELEGLICQIFGCDPLIMAKAAKRIEDEGFLGVDINFGCSVSGITKQGCGAALLKEPEKAVEIVKAVRDAVNIPVSVKFRTGWQDDHRIPVKMAKLFEDAGCDMLTFHPRVSPDRRTRKANWSYIKYVKEAVKIPVFGNGDIFSMEDCFKMFNDTGCDGASIGRLAIAKPWIFKEISEGKELPDTKYKETVLMMIDLVEKYFEPVTAMKLFKKFSVYFTANFKYGHSIFKEYTNQKTFDDLRRASEKIFEITPDVTKKPNMYMFN